MAVLATAEGAGWLFRWTREGLRWLLLLSLLQGVFLHGATTAAAVFGEYQIKAVFLYNFAQFVEWPATAFANETTPLVIGVLGDDPFDGVLDAAVKEEKLGQRPLEIRRFGRVEEISTCHILFISRSESARLDRILSSLRDRSVLTVSDMEDFTRRGGIIRFLTENKKVRMRINLDGAKRVGLTISSKLLRPAEIVQEGLAR